MTNDISLPQNEAITTLDSFQAMYYLLKGKRDTDIKLFDENKIFSKSDFIELNDRIGKKLQNHEVNSGITRVTVTLSNKEIKDYGNWISFQSSEWHESCYTHSVVIEWDFNILFPNQFGPVPQTHTVRVRIGSGMRPNEFFHVVMTGAEDFEIEEVMSEMVCKIDFVNTHLCNELKNIVSEWYSALPKNQPTSLWVKRVSRHRGKLELFINFLFLITATFILNLGFRSFIPYLNLSQGAYAMKWLFLALTLSFPVLYVCLRVSNFYGDRIIEGTVRRFKRSPMILLTRGDANRQAETKTENNKLIKDLATKMTVTLLANVLGWILSQYIPHVLDAILKYYRG